MFHLAVRLFNKSAGLLRAEGVLFVHAVSSHSDEHETRRIERIEQPRAAAFGIPAQDALGVNLDRGEIVRALVNAEGGWIYHHQIDAVFTWVWLVVTDFGRTTVGTKTPRADHRLRRHITNATGELAAGAGELRILRLSHRG